jgi:hypothetical protein
MYDITQFAKLSDNTLHAFADQLSETGYPFKPLDCEQLCVGLLIDTAQFYISNLITKGGQIVRWILEPTYSTVEQGHPLCGFSIIVDKPS